MDPLLSALHNGIATDVFVFPSQTAAAHWQRRVLDLGYAKAVRSDRLISWDVFKERYLTRRRDERPVSQAERSVFVRSFLSENARRPALTYLLPPDHAGNSLAFRRQLESTLPNLHVLETRLAAGDHAFRSDVELLRKGYDDFLKGRRLYEPSFEPPVPARVDRQVHIVFPELITDFNRYRDVVNRSPGVGLIYAEKASGAELIAYPNSLHEIRALMVALARRLDAGDPPHDILVTAAGLDSASVAEAARLRNIPLSLRSGRPLGDTRGADLFVRLREAASFDAAAWKALFLDDAYPWRRPRENRALVLHGIRLGCLDKQAWRAALPRMDEATRDAFSRAESHVDGFTRTRGFKDLLAGVLSFAKDNFDESAWIVRNHRPFNLAVEVLADLAHAEAECPFPAVDYFETWLDLLSVRSYVPEPETEGISVYPYPVAVGTYPKHHFFVGLNRSATTLREGRFGFLRDDLRERLGLLDEDFTEPYLAVAGASGEKVAMSYCEEDAGRPGLAPAHFVRRGAARTVAKADLDADRGADPLWVERRYWAGLGPLPETLATHQREGLLRHPADSPRMTKTPLASVERELVLRRLAFDDGDPVGRLALSASALESYRTCPFGFLVGRVMGLAEQQFDIVYDDPRTVGTLYHRVLQGFFSGIGTGRRFDKTQKEGYRKELAALLDQALGSPSCLPRPVRRSLYSAMILRLYSYVEKEAELFDGYEVVAVEDPRCKELSEELVLTGRLDRVSRSPSGDLVLVDYKKGSAPSNGSLHGDAQSAFQIPIYVELAGGASGVEAAAYYSLEDEKFTFVVGGSKPVVQAEEVDDWVAATHEALRVAAGRIRQGEFPATEEHCPECEWRALCRTKYALP